MSAITSVHMNNKKRILNHKDFSVSTNPDLISRPYFLLFSFLFFSLIFLNLPALFSQECVFNKQSESTVLHVTFEGSMRVGFCNSCCKRWFFAFDGLECQTANIEARLQGIKVFAGMEYRHVRLEGYCALPAGEVAVELWVEDCVGHQRAPKVPFIRVDLNPRVIVEEISMSQI